MNELVLLRAITLDETWVDDSLCQQVGTALFYPDQGGHVEHAKRVCSRCPVLEECRDYALRVGEVEGVWGGLSPNERERIRVETGTVNYSFKARRRRAA